MDTPSTSLQSHDNSFGECSKNPITAAILSYNGTNAQEK